MKSMLQITLFSVVTLSSTYISADEVILDDLIVQGSQCVGVECNDSEDFGFDTLRLKGSDPRINLIDTSNSSSFPSNDWMLGTKSDSATDVPYFYIKDVTSDKVMLRMTAGDRSAVAIGLDSDLIPGTISVGSVGGERRVVNVAAGTASNDAVTKAQLDAAAASLNARIEALAARLNDL